ncbi:hypothetical protein AB751O23_BJ_00090 [Chlamydiales bacterium SCGC AB-751-O23]|jgi:hypothetical protein|nr:hypothetical protein AB751O23_BJ_00090 [Chlamydiales bacterium SCGC AB-751-O23]
MDSYNSLVTLASSLKISTPKEKPAKPGDAEHAIIIIAGSVLNDLKKAPPGEFFNKVELVRSGLNSMLEDPGANWEVKETLQETQGAVQEIYLSRANNKRFKALANIPNRNTLLATPGNLNKEEPGNILSEILEMSEIGLEVDEKVDEEVDDNLDFVEVIEGISSMNAEELPFAVAVAETLYAVYSQPNNEELRGLVARQIIKDCNESPDEINMVGALFKVFDFFGFDNFQEMHFQPFQEVFPNIPLNQAPDTIKSLVMKGNEGLDLSRFRCLEKLDSRGANLTDEQLAAIPNKGSVQHLILPRPRDVSIFGKLKVLDFYYSEEPLTLEQFNAIPNKGLIEEIRFPFMQNLEGFDLSAFKNLKKLDLSNGCFLLAKTFNSIPKDHIEEIKFSPGETLKNFDFSGLKSLKRLDLSKVGEDWTLLTAAQFNSIPKGMMEEIKFHSQQNLTDFDFSGLENLKKLDLSNSTQATAITADQFNVIPKGRLEELKFNYCQNITDFSFSGLDSIKNLDLEFLDNTLTLGQFTEIPKGMIEDFKLPSQQECTGFEFSGFNNLKRIDASRCEATLTRKQIDDLPKEQLELCQFPRSQDFTLLDFSLLKSLKVLDFSLYRITLTADQFNAIPKRLIEKIKFPPNQKFEGFKFSGLTNLKVLNIPYGSLTADQFNEIPKGLIEEIMLPWEGAIEGFDFRGLNNLKELDVSTCGGQLSLDQFRDIPKRLIEKIKFHKEQIFTDFEFSELTNHKELDFYTYIALEETQRASLSEKSNIGNKFLFDTLSRGGESAFKRDKKMNPDRYN